MKIDLKFWFLFSLCLVILGGLLNTRVAVFNGSKMPVYVGNSTIYANDDTHFIYNKSSNITIIYEQLVDKYHFKTYLISLGDIIAFLGFASFVFVCLLQICLGVYQIIKKKRSEWWVK